MPSERRLHPATLVFDLARHVKQFAVPAVVVILGVSGTTGGQGGMYDRLPSGWEVWLLVLFVPATLFSIARYLSFRLHYAERELVIRSGLIFRNERHIPFSRIQNVDAVQNVFHRLFGVVEVRLETGGGAEEEARLSVLAVSALDELRARVFAGTSHSTPSQAEPSHPVLLHMPVREVLLFGFLENKGMVLMAAGFGAAWEVGAVDLLTRGFFETTTAAGQGLARDLFEGLAGRGPLPVARLAIAAGAFALFLVFVRLLSLAWAFLRLYDFRLTRVGEDLRTDYGLFTKVATTIPVRRVQTITIHAGPLHRWLDRVSVTVATAGGAGGDSMTQGREQLAPLIRERALPDLLREIVPGFDLAFVNWQPVHPRAFARAIKPSLIFTTLVTLIAAFFIGAGAIGVAMVMLSWSAVSTHLHVKHLAWAEQEDVVMMRSGWLWQSITLARVNKIQAVMMQESPFDRRAAMAVVRVDTAGAGQLSHRVAIPYLDRDVAAGLSQRLAGAAANVAFRW